uniref:Uncharacterized protein n=1 Tax=Trieres chinensis TaxID=1514140 RepID=A0A7S2A1P5_TRICV|mmetsp:Transcript_37656/g.76853  ORF Transcript_37656/g.76853 Transcript_37656/m.76853 type:complete len:158 (+) Transcript_37656:1-474(+)
MSANADGDGEPDVAGEEAPVIAQSVVRIDDGGSDLTDRFKYKVNALMGTFDPPGGSADDENQNGNILNAMMTFPTQYAFNVVGKTGGGDAAKESYVETVKGIIASSSGDDERAMECRVTPRGAKFTRVSVTAMVGSAAVINTIYDELAALEMTVMRY